MTKQREHSEATVMLTGELANLMRLPVWFWREATSAVVAGSCRSVLGFLAKFRSRTISFGIKTVRTHDMSFDAIRGAVTIFRIAKHVSVAAAVKPRTVGHTGMVSTAPQRVRLHKRYSHARRT